MTRLASRLAPALLLAVLGCMDDGTIGRNDVAGSDAAPDAPSTCPPCELDEVCDPQSGRCLECTGADDCEAPDECDDCPLDDAACIAMFCRPCSIDEDCGSDEPVCSQGRCVEGFDP
jgi:hypothetical protein